MAGKKKESMTPFDIKDADKQPNDGDLCKVTVFDSKKGKAVEGPLAVFDVSRGVFFKEPERDDDGNMVNTSSNAIGTRRDNYKAERIRNVTEFAVVEEGHDAAPEPDSVIDHARGMEHASTRPPPVTTPPDTE